MLLIKKRYLFFYLFISVSILITLNIAFYKILMFLYNKFDDSIIKFYAENFIYFSIISIVLLIIIFIYIIIKSINLDRNLDKIIELSKNSNIDISVFFNKLDKFGVKINYLINNLNEISRIKSLKIYSYWNIINFFLEKFNNDALLIEKDGHIINASQDIFLNINIDNKDIIKNNINAIFEDFNFFELTNKLTVNKSFITVNDIKFKISNKSNKINLTFFPIFDLNNNLTYTIAIKNAKEELLKNRTITHEENKNKTGIGNLLDKIKKNINKFKKK